MLPGSEIFCMYTSTTSLCNLATLRTDRREVGEVHLFHSVSKGKKKRTKQIGTRSAWMAQSTSMALTWTACSTWTAWSVGQTYRNIDFSLVLNLVFILVGHLAHKAGHLGQ